MNKQLYKLASQIAEVRDLQIPGFYSSVPRGSVGQHCFKETNFVDLYERFFERCQQSIGRSNLPIFRISDGEFYFTTGFRAPSPPAGRHWLWHLVRVWLGRLRVGRFPWRFRSGAPKYGWEEYSGMEWLSARRLFKHYLQWISTQGYLAVNFTVTKPAFAEQYLHPFCNWLDKSEIKLHPDNYIPFYFVYALLLGPRARDLLHGRRVGVLTSATEEKRAAIEGGLFALGARTVTFVQLSRSKALFDTIDLSKLTGIEVALVGAGVGASSILFQLRSIPALCVDAGFCLECIANPQLRAQRVFCNPDRILP